MKLTVGQLIQLLEEAASTAPEGEETEVRFAHQPNYPLEAGIAEQVVLGENGVLYVAESAYASGGYLPGDVSSELGWR